MSEEAKTQMQEVEDSAWVSRWLVEDYGTQTNSESSSSKGINLTLLLPIIGGVVVVIALVCLLVFIKRRRKQRCEDVPVEDNPATPNAVCQGWSDGKQVHGSSRSDTRVCFAETQATVDDTETTSRRLAQEALKRNSAFERDTSSESNVTLKTLLCSEHLVEKRIPFESIHFDRAIFKGVNGEVWVGEYSGQQVAIKRLLQAIDNRADEVEEFSKEIELSASLAHPNIVTFIGVAWNSLGNLVMVLEYFPVGDLQGYLAKNADLLTWAKDKSGIAVGVGRAVEYLHSQSPPLIHRDLKSKNIMLTRKLEPKIIDLVLVAEDKSSP
ncbi:hypothetical protein PF007_g16612 [Phytophthora fragariae]|uniref:Protein kinase domain-containing protein n=1 Tax=Phytophthora fragariae TaxID=53985 RepID=A0A6A3ECG4_9STRA|nr:hypothetical protein PF009_g18704 [Phytophthora fragariae]KAE9097450.1 hypothetical protein PF007_g16612 [Phytophthora fragariae]